MRTALYYNEMKHDFAIVESDSEFNEAIKIPESWHSNTDYWTTYYLLGVGNSVYYGRFIVNMATISPKKLTYDRVKKAFDIAFSIKRMTITHES